MISKRIKVRFSLFVKIHKENNQLLNQIILLIKRKAEIENNQTHF